MMGTDELLKLEPEQVLKLDRSHLDAYNEEIGIRMKTLDEIKQRRQHLASQG